MSIIENEQSEDEQPSNVQYVCLGSYDYSLLSILLEGSNQSSGAVVEGLPTHKFFERSYRLKFTLDGKKAWKTSARKTKCSTLKFEEKETYELCVLLGRQFIDHASDGRQSEQSPGCRLEVTLYQGHLAPFRKELGKAVLPLSSWLQDGIVLTSSPTKKRRNEIRVRLTLALKSCSDSREKVSDSVQVAPKATMEAATTEIATAIDDDVLLAHEATTKAMIAVSRLRTPMGHRIFTSIPDDINSTGIEEMASVESAWQPLLEKVQIFVQVVDAMAEVRTCCSVQGTS